VTLKRPGPIAKNATKRSAPVPGDGSGNLLRRLPGKANINLSEWTV
jgi:hypothetical protein